MSRDKLDAGGMCLKFVSTVILAACSLYAAAQDIGGGTQSDGKRINSIITAAPFLMIGPDSRSGGMGDVGAATAPDANSMHWNPAKYAFIETQGGVSLAFTPWLKQLIDDINLAYLAGYYKIDNRQTLAGSIRYFSLGDITFTDPQGNEIQQYNPSEFALDAAYIRKLTDNFSIAMALRYIHSNLGAGSYNGTNVNPGTSVAADVGIYYTTSVPTRGEPTDLSYGVTISNIGSKMQYGSQKYFIPTNFRAGGAATFHLDKINQLTIALDLNKLLVPTSPYRDAEGNIIAGKDPDRSVPSGIFGSFTDAPGGFREELHEISASTGLEYWYDDLFALRGGFLYEHPTKGNRKFYTLGAGIKYTSLHFDFAYLIPTDQQNPMEKTLRFTLLYNFGPQNEF
ncbi:hypothetical protein EDD80_11122 [Anseongella ginsenosidimutans]|uniref:Type IX secretion system protein PorV domain-containing protein n=1 Tax=Anseongella ginsenosidimutans TaxID=496056 RepID=A0A4R3KMP4_9SPHI|nr:type IX secretion system outer membrane channel protein PorV [Anseongella ginsenosidimutans]TCS85620.1 hypothetical protein EDD80_11122 [Anseongella ginsenosidimutans]